MDAADKESSCKRTTSEPNVSIMNADLLEKMKKLFQQLGGVDKDSASESSSEAGSLSRESSEESLTESF